MHLHFFLLDNENITDSSEKKMEGRGTVASSTRYVTVKVIIRQWINSKRVLSSIQKMRMVMNYLEQLTLLPLTKLVTDAIMLFHRITGLLPLLLLQVYQYFEMWCGYLNDNFHAGSHTTCSKIKKKSAQSGVLDTQQCNS